MLEFDKSEKTAVVVIDMQTDFLEPGGILAAEGSEAIIPGISRLLDLAREKGFPILYTKEMHRSCGSDFGIEDAFEPFHCVEGTGGLEIVDALKPKDGDFIIANKRRYDAFMGTDMDLLLRDLKVKNLIFTGVCTDICVISTIHHARNLDYKVAVLTDCTAGSNRERHEMAFKLMEHCFAKVMNLEEAIQEFEL